jgi:hypothetical protein
MFLLPAFPSLVIAGLSWDLAARLAGQPKKKSVLLESEYRRPVIASIIVVNVFAISLATLGSMNYFYVQDDGVHYNPLLSFKEDIYNWGDIVEIQTRCLAERDNLHLNYRLKMKDNTVVDLMEEPRLRFIEVYREIKPFLDAQTEIKYTEGITDGGIKRLKKRYRPEAADRILKVLSNGT